jgi:hypothetical protein
MARPSARALCDPGRGHDLACANAPAIAIKFAELGQRPRRHQHVVAAEIDSLSGRLRTLHPDFPLADAEAALSADRVALELDLYLRFGML